MVSHPLDARRHSNTRYPTSTLMYSHREEKTRVDVVDLDPYGTVAPFIDGAVQCVKDGGECRHLSDVHSDGYVPHEAYCASPARIFLC